MRSLSIIALEMVVYYVSIIILVLVIFISFPISVFASVIVTHTITILILPLVSLGGDLLRRVCEPATDHCVWTLHETRNAPLVFVSAEAAGTEAFRAYAYKLAAANDGPRRMPPRWLSCSAAPSTQPT